MFIDIVDWYSYLMLSQTAEFKQNYKADSNNQDVLSFSLILI
jgi:hypothetical protein